MSEAEYEVGNISTTPTQMHDVQSQEPSIKPLEHNIYILLRHHCSLRTRVQASSGRGIPACSHKSCDWTILKFCMPLSLHSKLVV